MARSNNVSRILTANSLYIAVLLIILAAGAETTYANLVPAGLMLWFFVVRPADILKPLFNKNQACVFYPLLAGILLHILGAKYFYGADLAKFLAIFFFFLLGLGSRREIEFGEHPNFSAPQSHTRVKYLPLVAIPVLCAITFVASDVQGQHNSAAVLFFSNRNNAVAYTLVALFCLYSISAERKSHFYWIAAVAALLLYSTIGALIAFVVAVCIVYAKKKPRRLVVIALVGTAVVATLEYSGLSIFERVKALASGWMNYTTAYRVIDIQQLEYSDLVQITGSQGDISAFFRIKHWLDIVAIAQTDPTQILPGWGMAASTALTQAMLVPHNDWLRILFELGALNFVAFAILNLRVVTALRRHDAFLSAIFLTVNIYMFSENLINNYLIVSFLYFFAGRGVAAMLPARSPATRHTRSRLAEQTGAETLA